MSATISTIETVAVDVLTEAPAIVSAVSQTATDAQALFASNAALSDRLASAEKLLADAVAFLNFAFPGHPNLPTNTVSK